MFTWVAYERLSKTSGFISAMVPRRIPNLEEKEITLQDGSKIKEKHLASFTLEHYAMMVNDYHLDIEINSHEIEGNSDYNNFLPLDRMQSFHRDKFYISCKAYYRSKYSSTQSYDNSTINSCMKYEDNFSKWGTGDVLRSDVIAANKDHKKSDVYKVHTQF